MTTFLLKLWKKLGLSKMFQLRIMRVLNDQFLIGVTGIIFNKHQQILIFKHSYRTTPWSLPGGYVKAKEHPKEALEREIEEESGFVVSIDWRMKVRTDRETGRLDMPYIGTFIGGKFKASDEVTEAKFYNFKDLPLIRRDQLFLIEKALEQKKIFYSKNRKKDSNITAQKREIANL